MNYSSLYVALETEQLFGEQLIQATSRFEMRYHKYTYMRITVRQGEVRGGRHFRDLKVAEAQCLFSDIKRQFDVHWDEICGKCNTIREET